MEDRERERKGRDRESESERARARERERERERGGSCVSRACYTPVSTSLLPRGGGRRGDGVAKLCEECAISEQSMRWSRG